MNDGNGDPAAAVQAWCPGVWGAEDGLREADLSTTLLSHRMDFDVYKVFITFMESYLNGDLTKDAIPALPSAPVGQCLDLAMALQKMLWISKEAVYQKLKEADVLQDGESSSQAINLVKKVRDACLKNFRNVLKSYLANSEGLEIPSGNLHDLLNLLPKDLPCNSDIEVFSVPTSDPRTGLHGQDGVRVKRTRQATLPTGTFIGTYRSQMSFAKEYDEYQRTPIGDIGHLEAGVLRDAYAADAESFNPSEVAVSAGMEFDGMISSNSDFHRLVLSAYSIGNETCIVNDPHLEPANGLNGGRLQPNATLLEVRLGPWPFIAMFTLRDINPGEELLYDYGQKYWLLAKDNARWLKAAVEEKSWKMARLMSQPTGGTSGIAAASHAAIGGETPDLGDEGSRDAPDEDLQSEPASQDRQSDSIAPTEVQHGASASAATLPLSGTEEGASQHLDDPELAGHVDEDDNDDNSESPAVEADQVMYAEQVQEQDQPENQQEDIGAATPAAATDAETPVPAAARTDALAQHLQCLNMKLRYCEQQAETSKSKIRDGGQRKWAEMALWMHVGAVVTGPFTLLQLRQKCDNREISGDDYVYGDAVLENVMDAEEVKNIPSPECYGYEVSKLLLAGAPSLNYTIAQAELDEITKAVNLTNKKYLQLAQEQECVERVDESMGVEEGAGKEEEEVEEEKGEEKEEVQVGARRRSSSSPAPQRRVRPRRMAAGGELGEPSQASPSLASSKGKTCAIIDLTLSDEE